MSDWDTYAENTPSIDPTTIKAELPIEWVVTVEAQIPMEQHGDKLIGLCPFHNDVDNPSLDIYEGGARWGCRVDGKGGDVLDFIRDFWSIDGFKEQMVQANIYLQNYRQQSGDWQPHTTEAEEAYEADLNALLDEWLEAFHRYEDMSDQPLHDLLDQKSLEISADWLHEKWNVGTTATGQVLAPYIGLSNKFISHKVRTDTGWMAAKGAELSILYGERQLAEADIDKPVWIMEGETDTWLASWLLGDRGIALGLPTGAGTHPRTEWLDLLQGRRVTIMLDNDDAGRKAAMRWHAILKGRCAAVLIAWPDGPDLCNSSNPGKALWSGVPVSDEIGNIVKSNGGYHVVNKDGELGQQLSNWTLTPHKRIEVVDIHDQVLAHSLEVSFDDQPGKKIIVDDKIWQNHATMLKWANLHGKAWLGAGSKNSQALFSNLVAMTPFLGKEKGVSLIGLHGVDSTPVFVLPTETVGNPDAAKGWLYAAPDNEVDFSKYQLMGDLDNEALKAWGAPIVNLLMQLSSPAIITVMLGWMAAAPGRSLFDEFPPLGVFGGSDTGKTTLVKALMRALWGLAEENNLSDTTPYAVRQWVAGTNAIPVWYDEYRKGGKPETLLAMEQILRDAWSASSSSRGGVGDNLSRVHESRVSAPIIISGEESMEERSHIDRVVALALSEDDKNPEALRQLQKLTDRDSWGRIGHAYLRWFLWKLATDQLYLPEPEQNRQAQADSVITWGWEMWVHFCREVFDIQVNADALDLSRVHQAREAPESPILEALTEALDTDATLGYGNTLPLAWVVHEADPEHELESCVAVRVHDFTQWADKAGYKLPGGTRSTKDWLVNRFAGTTGRVRPPSGLGDLRSALRVVKLFGMIEQIESDQEEETT